MLRLDFGEKRASGTARVFDNPLRARAIWTFIIAAEHGCFIQAAQDVAVAPHVAEDARGGVGKWEGRDAGVIQDVSAGRDFRPTHPAGEHRFAGRAGVGFEVLRGSRRPGHALRTRDGKQAIDVGIVGGDVDNLGIALRQRVPEHVDRVVVAPVRRE